MATIALRTRWFCDSGPTVTLTMPGMCRASTLFVIAATFAESAAVSWPPSARENTMMAAAPVTFPVCGNALSWRSIARMDS